MSRGYDPERWTGEWWVDAYQWDGDHPPLRFLVEEVGPFQTRSEAEAAVQPLLSRLGPGTEVELNNAMAAAR